MTELRFIHKWSSEQHATTKGWLWRWSRRVYEKTPAHARTSDQSENIIFIHTRRLLALLALTLVMAYASLAVTAWWWFHRRLGENVTLIDAAWPPRWAGLVQARTDALFTQGFTALQEHRFGDAARLLEAGLRRAPERNEARLALATIFGTFHEYGRAFAQLDQAFAHPPVSSALLATAFTVSFTAEDFVRALAYAQKILDAQPPASPDLTRLARQNKIRALTALGRSDEAVAAAALLAAEPDPTSLVCRIDALRSHRQFAAALALAHAAQTRFPAHLAVLDIACRTARDASNPAELRSFLAAAITAQPNVPAPRQTAVLEWWQAGDTAQSQSALDAFLLRFDSDPDFVYRLSTAATAIGATTIVERLYQHEAALGLPTNRLAANLVEAHIINGDLVGLRRTRPLLPALAATKDPVLQLWPPLVQAIFQVVDDAPLSSGPPLQSLVRRLGLVPTSYTRFIDLLLNAQRPAAACALLDQALAAYPTSASLQRIAPAARAALAAATADRDRVPAPSIAPVLDAPEFFARGDDLLSSGQFTALARLIAEQRRANPDWLAQRSGDVAWLELRLALATHDELAARRLGQLYLNGDQERLERAIAFAARLPVRDAADQRALLTDAILRHHPEAQARLIEAGLIKVPVPSAE